MAQEVLTEPDVQVISDQSIVSSTDAFKVGVGVVTAQISLPKAGQVSVQTMNLGETTAFLSRGNDSNFVYNRLLQCQNIC